MIINKLAMQGKKRVKTVKPTVACTAVRSRVSKKTAAPKSLRRTAETKAAPEPLGSPNKPLVTGLKSISRLLSAPVKAKIDSKRVPIRNIGIASFINQTTLFQVFMSTFSGFGILKGGNSIIKLVVPLGLIIRLAR